MSAAVYAFILTGSTLGAFTVVAGVLSRPSNVSLLSYNMNLVLTWDPPQGVNDGLVYTAEFRSFTAGTYTRGCVNISTFECDFTRLSKSVHQTISVYGKYIGRVQAHLGSESSAWVESNEISLDKETIIGPPTIRLFSNRATLEVNIEDPVFVASALRDVYSYVTYNITYWEDGQRQKAKHISNLYQNRAVLNGLNPWTKYCIQVQINTLDSDPNPSKPSRIVCESTTSEDAPWVTAVVTFFVIAMALALVVVTMVYRRSMSHFLCPKDALPQHIKEYLLTPPTSNMYLEMEKPRVLEENYDSINVIAHEKTMEEVGPLEKPGGTCSSQPDIMMRERWEEGRLTSTESLKNKQSQSNAAVGTVKH